MTRNDFLIRLYAYCDGLLELRAIPSRKQVFYDVTDYDNIDKFCKQYEQENVYFSVALRNGKDGTKNSITQIACLHCDIDFKDIPEKQAIKRIKEFEFVPTLIVRSGGGFHLYWRLKEPYGKEDIIEIEKTNRMLACALSGDLNACDASRILRLPDTWNVKKEYGTPRRVVCTRYKALDYDVSDFDNLTNCNQSVDKSGVKCPSMAEKVSLNSSVLYSLDKSIDNIYNTSIKLQEPGHIQHQEVNFTKGHRDQSLFHVANCLVKGGMTKDNILKTMVILGGACKPPFNERELIAKIKSAVSRKTVREKSLADEVREWVLSSKGDFLSSEVVKEVDLSSFVVMGRQDSSSVVKVVTKNVSKILGRLCDEGVIERAGSKRGSWRVVEKECDDIDYQNAVAEPLFFRWPLPGLETMIEIFPGNIIVIAGVMNAGKSAFMLDFTFKNMAKHDIYYFSSEMGDIEMKKRLLMFNMDLGGWKFHAKARSFNFPDVIRPRKINIIDYLEIHDNFYQISGTLKDIHDRLDGGIALIAVQKNPGAPTGIGGYRGLEKPRLYLNLEPEYPGGRCKIVKAKNWATSINPNGYSCKFKLISGCHFVEEGNWELLN